MKKLFTCIFIGAVLSAAAAAQDINQSVQVENDFESTVSALSRSSMEMSVPDTLLSFDYKFDYSVFDSPYKGAYEFSPYIIQISPEASLFDGKKLYLRAGMGYQMRPELEFAFAPQTGKKSAMSLYARGGGYRQSDGHDLSGTAGFENRWMFRKSQLSLGVEYKGIFTEDGLGSINYHNGSAYLKAKSLSAASFFQYNLSLSYRFGADILVQTGKQLEQLLNFSGNFGFALKNGFRLMADFSLRKSFNSGMREANPGFISVTPRLVLPLGPFKLNAGIKVDKALDLTFTPTADISMPVFNKTALFSAGVRGGQDAVPYYGFKDANHRFNIYWMYDSASDAFSGFSRIKRDKIDIFAGLRGHIGETFNYALSGGYASRGNMPLEYVAGQAIGYKFNDYTDAYAKLDMKFKSRRFRFEAAVDFDYLVKKDGVIGFAPAMLKGNVNFGYDCSERLSLGLSLDASSARTAYGMSEVDDIPSWFDLGVLAQYRINSRWACWARGGNLLGQKIQRIPTYTEKGPYITLGISLNL